jgi:hypothetical protein
MSQRTAFLAAAFITTFLSIGCSSVQRLSPRESAIRDGLWSESTLVRGASPDDVTTALILTDTTGTTPPLSQPVQTSVPGPAYDGTALPGCMPRAHAPLNICDDWNCLLPELCHDVDALLNCHDLGVLLAAGGVSFLLHETVDDEVAESYERHPNRWGKSQDFFAAIGNPAHHFAAIGAIYLYSLHAQDVEAHELSKSLFNAVAITGLTTVALKATIGSNTTAPNREPDPFGGAWPSGHTSSSFAVAAVLDEYYGPVVGIPAYILAGLVGWERIDDGEHDLSDVVFGAVLGYVIGKTVASEHRVCICGMELQPMVDASTGATGVCFERRF